MAVTGGQGNPNWTREEVALALDLYFSIGERMPSKTDKEVVALSDFLRFMWLHKDAQKNDKFRNPAGVAFKIGNIRAVATGKGLQNTSKIDRDVWEEFNNNRGKLNDFCRTIREAVKVLNFESVDISDDDEAEFDEGRVLTKIHKVRERNKGLRGKLIRKLEKENNIFCEMCGVKPNAALGYLALRMFECHHIVPVSEAVREKTKLSELSLLCANCHKLMHAAISKEKRWLSISEVVNMLDIKK